MAKQRETVTATDTGKVYRVAGELTANKQPLGELEIHGAHDEVDAFRKYCHEQKIEAINARLRIVKP